MDRGAWRAIVDGVTKSWTRLRDFKPLWEPGVTPTGQSSRPLGLSHCRACASCSKLKSQSHA